jgi:tetratricopeptide (TPR) repeat protein
VREAEKAAQLDPLNLKSAVGWPLYTSHQYDEAEKIFRRYSIHLGLGWVYIARGQYPQAITELLAEENYGGRSDNVLASLGQAYALQGKKREAQVLLEELKQRSKTRYVSPYLLAGVFSGQGDGERTLSALQQAYEEHDEWTIYVKVDPAFDQFHSDLRFQKLLRDMGLSD